MEIKYCKNEDGKIAVGTGKRPIEFCRDCYRTELGSEFVEAKVVVPWRDLGIDREALAIACAKTGEDIYEGGTVWLDPVETNILALVYSGFVEVVPAKPAKAAATRVTEA